MKTIYFLNAGYPQQTGAQYPDGGQGISGSGIRYPIQQGGAGQVIPGTGQVPYIPQGSYIPPGSSQGFPSQAGSGGTYIPPGSGQGGSYIPQGQASGQGQYIPSEIYQPGPSTLVSGGEGQGKTNVVITASLTRAPKEMA